MQDDVIKKLTNTPHCLAESELSDTPGDSMTQRLKLHVSQDFMSLLGSKSHRLNRRQMFHTKLGAKINTDK